jgi:hypothetical protein
MSSQQIRQSELFAGEDWTVLYRAFSQINFNSYDPASINAALREYLQTNFPEDFDDWIESSEFVAIIDLLSWLAGSLAFRTDVNARENFLETAESRESVLRLARFLSYNPRRAQSARGLVKVSEIRTTESVVDSFGVNLNNRSIKWNDPDNPDWMEQFTLILNAAMPTTNPFGIPLKQATLGGAMTQLYRVNNAPNPQCVYGFDAPVDGSNEKFEIVNSDFDASEGFSERAPDPSNSFHLMFRNDGKGNASTRTGFFCLFKQGSLRQELFTISNPVENRVLDIDAQNISETDVWVQSVSDYGNTSSQWEKVPAVFGENITFTNISPDIRDIFSVISRDDDQVSLRFGDGRFGNVPVGNLKVWYRVVNGQQYTIRPRDINNVTITIPYDDINGRRQNLTMKVSLEESVSNAVGSEDIDQVRRRAPQVYGAQNRMVSGEDYNVFPLTSNEVVKLRAVNRVYSGHSRYIDINDPTATFQDTVVYADDGILFRDGQATEYTQVPASANLSPEQIIGVKIIPMLQSIALRDYVQSYFLDKADTEQGFNYQVGEYQWSAQSSSGFSSVGIIPNVFSPSKINDYLRSGCRAKFEWTGARGEQSSKWVYVSNVQRIDGQPSARVMTIDDVIPNTASLVKVMPAFRDTPTSQIVLERLDDGNSPKFSTTMGTPVSEVDQLLYFVASRLPFNLYYFHGKNSTTSAGKRIVGQWIAQAPTEAEPPNSILVLTGEFQGGQFWAFETQKGMRYIFESVSDVRWSKMRNHKVADGEMGVDRRDTITVLWTDGWTGENRPVTFDITDNVYASDGYPIARKVVVTPTDSDDDGSPDDPEAFRRIVTPGVDSVVYEIDTTGAFQGRFARQDIPVALARADEPLTTKGQKISLNLGDYYWSIEENTVVAHLEPGVPQDAANFVLRKDAKSNLKFQWKHYAGTDVRIDPAATNIIDVFVLTSEYDFLVRQWIKEGAIADDMPSPPNDLDLGVAFSEFEQYKMFSDELIWRPVKYKYLFGSSALPELQAQFKIVRLPNATLSDGEIRSRVIQAINEYFDVNKWEFGETFYFTELAAYIHIQLATAVASVVIVPLQSNGAFGNLFEVRCATDEVFISTAQVSDVVIIDGNTVANLRIK